MQSIKSIVINISGIRKSKKKLCPHNAPMIDKNQSRFSCGLPICNTAAIVDGLR